MQLDQWRVAFLVCYLLANNPLTHTCPQNCQCSNRGKWNKVDCSGLGLTEIPYGIPLNTYDLDLSSNGLQQIPPQIFKNMTSLVTLDISENFLKAEDLVNILNGSNKLQTLVASRNPLGPVLPETLCDQNENFNELILTDCKLEAIKPKTFGCFSKLTSLNLDENSITRLEHGVFEGLTDTLNYMRLNNNQLKHIDKGLFRNLTGLNTLYLGENKLEKLPDLTGVSSVISYLNLANNFIEDISTLPTFGIRFVVELRLQSNKIQEVPPDVFQRINVIGSLDLSNNRIQRVPDGAFTGCTSLTELFLYRNSIQRITPGTFEGLTGMKILLLFNNSLRAIPDFTFNDSPSIQLLLLHQNNISVIGKDAFHGTGKHMKTMTLFSNPLASLPSKIFEDLNNGTKMAVSCKYLSNIPTPIKVAATVKCASSGSFHLIVKSYLLDSNGLQTSGFSIKRCTNDPHCKNYTLCQPGYHGGDLQIGEDCIPCASGGFYQDEQGRLECNRCGPGTYVSVERHPGTSPLDCWACPKGTATDESAGHRACRCLPEFYRTDRFGACRPCPVTGIVCKNDAATLAPNYYWSWTNKTQEYEYQQFVKNIAIAGPAYDATYSRFNGSLPVHRRCFRDNACIGGLESKCSDGYTGLLCSQCKSSHFLRMNTCVKCPTKARTILTVAGVIIAFIVILVAVVWGDSRRTRDGRTWADVILSRFKIIVSFYQVIIGVFSALARVSWPVSVLVMTKWWRYVEANILELAPLGCIDSRLRFDSLQQFALEVSLNGIIVAAFLTYLFIREKVIHYKKNMSPEERLDALSAARKFCYRNLFLFLFTTYPSTCMKIVQILPPACFSLCFSEDETQCSSVLRSDLSIQCFTPRYNKYSYPAMAFLLYPLGFPLFVLALLWKYRDKSSTSQTLIDNQNEQSGNNGTDDPSNENEDETVSFVSPVSDSASETAKNSAEDYSSDDEVDVGNCRLLPVAEHRVGRQNGVRRLRYITSSLSLFYENYKPQYWFWEVTEMYRKLILVSGLALIGSHSRSQIGIGVLLAGGFAILHAAYRPIKDSFENALQAIALLVIFFDLTLGVMLKIADTDIPVDVNTKNDTTGVGVLFVFVNCLVIGIALVMAMKTILPHIIKCVRSEEGGGCCACNVWRRMRRAVNYEIIV